MPTELIDSIVAAEALADEWDDLSVRSGEPFMGAAWLLGWWRHAAPADALLRVVAVREGGRLIGVAPLWCRPARRMPVRYAFWGTGVSLRSKPLSLPGQEDVVFRAVADALSTLDPPVGSLAFDGVPPPAVHGLARAWPGGPAWQKELFSMPAPFVSFEAATYEDWLRTRSSGFRGQMSRNRRDLRRASCTYRFSDTPQQLRHDLQAFADLHRTRWESRGGSGVLTPAVERMLGDVGEGLLDSRRFRVWCMDVDGRPINVCIFVAAGTTISYWLGGFDEAWGRQQPALTGLTTALEAVWADGYRVLDLGGGGQPYKYRLADGEDPLTTSTMVPGGRRNWPARGEVGLALARRGIASRLSPEVKRRIKAMLRRVT